MFGRTTTDIEQTLTRMIEEARAVCHHDQYQMPVLMAKWMSEDRRFDGIPDKQKLAAEAMDAKSHGRELDLSARLRIDTQGAAGAPVIGRGYR
jgi:hypothetical protein